MIAFNCPHCDAPIKVADEAAGKKGECWKCGKTIKVPNRADKKDLMPASQPLDAASTAADSLISNATKDGGFLNRSVDRPVYAFIGLALFVFSFYLLKEGGFFLPLICLLFATFSWLAVYDPEILKKNASKETKTLLDRRPKVGCLAVAIPICLTMLGSSFWSSPERSTSQPTAQELDEQAQKEWEKEFQNSPEWKQRQDEFNKYMRENGMGHLVD